MAGFMTGFDGGGGDGVRIPLGLQAFLLFLVGLIFSSKLASVLGMDPAMFWASMTIIFFVGIYFLAKPKHFLLLALLYYGCFTNGVLFGRYYVPIPFMTLMDEVFLAVPLGIIVMKAIDRKLPKGATLFPLLYVVLAVLSYKVNSVPVLNAVRVTLSYLKFFIYWYFARAIGPWTDNEKRFLVHLLIVFCIVQFIFNVYWHKGLRIRFMDEGQGTIGNAHIVGYISILALFVIAGRVLTNDRPWTLLRVAWYGGSAMLIAYNLVFLTDTKHGLILALPTAIPFFLVAGRMKRFAKLLLVWGVTLFLLASALYLAHAATFERRTSQDYFRAMKYSGKGDVFRTIMTKLPHEVPFYLLGAGPGNFCSAPAVRSFRPLAVKYVLPYVIMRLRSRGYSSESSVIGAPQTSWFTLWGEFGPIAAIIYAGFWIHIIMGLWRRVREDHGLTPDSGQRLALISYLLLLWVLGGLIDVFAVGIMIFPVWSLVGVYWDDEKPRSEESREEEPADLYGSQKDLSRPERAVKKHIIPFYGS